MASRSPTPTTGGSTPSGRAAPDRQSGHQLFDNCRGIVIPGPRHGRSRGHGAGRAAVGRDGVRFPPDPPRASRLTGRAPGSYPGTDWVRDPGRAPCRRSSTGWSTGPSSRRVRVRVPSVAPRRRGRMEKAPAYEAGGCRFDSCRRRHLAVAQRSRAPPSEARRSHVRIVPARPTVPRWSRGQDAGPSTRRPGFESPSRYSMPGSRAAKTSGRYPEGGGSSPSLAAQRSVAEDSGARLQTARRG